MEGSGCYKGVVGYFVTKFKMLEMRWPATDARALLTRISVIIGCIPKVDCVAHYPGAGRLYDRRVVRVV